jgi:biotin carboxylase
MKKLLILGSDFGTISVVREAHKMGLYVIVADLMETSPTKELADEAWLLSSTDTDTLVQKCREENISALMFGASDFNVWNARKVCKQLNLPIYCESDYACRVARDKGEFKRICKAVGAPVATDYYLTDTLSDEELNGVVFPVVVKPVDKSGNRGMSYCHNRDELVAGYKAAREISDKEIIVERQLHGKEYNVHYVLADGHARLLYFSSTHHEPGEAENLYSFKCTTSQHLKQYIDEVNESAIAVIEKAECKEGIVWFDCIRDDDGHFYLLEMGYRFGGVMTYVPYEKVTGFNTVKWMLECALGVEHKEADLPPALDNALTGCAASYNLFSRRDGEIKEIVGLDKVAELPGVFIDIPKREGNPVRLNACMGLLGIYGSDIEEVCDRLKEVNSLLYIRNDAGENMFIKFDDYDSLREEYYTGIKQFE